MVQFSIRAFLDNPTRYNANSIHTFASKQEKIKKIEDRFSSFSNAKLDDSIRKYCNNEVFNNIELIHSHGSDLLNRVKEPLDKFAENKKSTERTKYNKLQRFAFRIGGVLKRGTFATKGEAAENLSKKLAATVTKLDQKNSGGLMAKVANINFIDMDDEEQSLLIGHLRHLSQNSFSKLFASSDLSSKDVAEVLRKYEFVELKTQAKSFIHKIAEVDPKILVSKELISNVSRFEISQDSYQNMAKALVALTDDQLEDCVVEMENKFTNNSYRHNARKVLQLMYTHADEDKKLLIKQNATFLGSELV